MVITLNSNLKNFFEYLLIFLTIITCNTVYMNLIGSNLNKILIIIYCINLILLLFVSGIKRVTISRFFMFLVFYYIYLIIFALFNNIGENLFEFVSYFVILLPIIVLYFLNINFENIRTLCGKFKKIIIILSFVSIIYYICLNLGLINNFNYLSVQWSATQNIKCVNGVYCLSQGINRNSFFFVEPAMYALMLVLALAIEIIENKSILNKIILSIAILTTNSVTGILIAIFCYSYYFYYNLKKSKLCIIIPFIMMFGLVLGIIIFQNKTASMSYLIRKDDFQACFAAWKSKPFFGVGFMKTDPIKQYMSYFRLYNQGLSNSLFILAAQGGIYLIILYIIPTVYAIKEFMKKREFLIILTFIILFTTTIFHFTILTFTFLAICISMLLKKGIIKSTDNKEVV